MPLSIFVIEIVRVMSPSQAGAVIKSRAGPWRAPVRGAYWTLDPVKKANPSIGPAGLAMGHSEVT